MIIKVPLWYGSRIKGVDQGAHDIALYIEKKGYPVTSIEVPLSKDRKNNSNFLNEIVDVSNKISRKVTETLILDQVPLILGGDHAVSIGSVAGVLGSINKENLAVIWVDAHGDLNNMQESITKNIHGMSLGVATGLEPGLLRNEYNNNFVKPSQTYLIGSRSLDHYEVNVIEKLGIWKCDMSNIKQQGIVKITEELLHDLAEKNIKNIHLSFDIDVLSQSVAPGTGTPVKGGMELEDAIFLLEKIFETGLVSSVDFVEYNPLIERQKTFKTVTTLIDFILERIYGECDVR